MDSGVLYSLEIPNSPVSVHSYFAVEILKEVAEGMAEKYLGEDSYCSLDYVYMYQQCRTTFRQSGQLVLS